MQQTFTQAITIVVGNPTGGQLANTGSSVLLYVVLGLLAALAALAVLWVLFRSRRTTPRKTRHLGSKLASSIALGIIVSAMIVHTTQAVSVLTIASDQLNLTIAVPEGGGTAEVQTTVTTSTTAATGYTFTAGLAETEPGIAIGIKGGAIATDTALVANTTPLLIKATTQANPSGAPDTTDITLKFTVDGMVTAGKKQIKLSYIATGNEMDEPDTSEAPLTMQTMTKSYCTNHMTIYNGTNEDAILTLNDPRGEGVTYEVAKLADGNCWMLNNLKLGSVASAIILTWADSNIALNTEFELPQVTDGTLGVDGEGEPIYNNSFDEPRAYGPVPGDTGVGETNYGYLYNWPAATAGETRTTMPADSGDAPYSICPANWRLPGGGGSIYPYTALPTNDFDILNVRMAGFASTTDPGYLALVNGPVGEAPAAVYQQSNWLYDGPFKGVFAGMWWQYSGADSSPFVRPSGTGFLSSRSTYPNTADFRTVADIDAGYLIPGMDYTSREFGVSVRCMM